jgi:transcription antitermination factor NusG
MWLVGITRPGEQRRAAQCLREQGCDIFLPMRPEKRRVGTKIQTVPVPRFDRYIFIYPNGLAVRTVCSTRGMSDLVKHADGTPGKISSADMHELMGICAATETMEKKAAAWFIDQRLTVENGPFAGISGLVKKILKGKLELEHMWYDPLTKATKSIKVTVAESDLAVSSDAATAAAMP